MAVDRQAFASFYRDHYAPLVGFFVRRVEDRELARDLAAEAFRIAWSRWGEDARPTRAWLFGVGRNLVGDEWRRRERRGPIGELPDTWPAPDGERDLEVRLLLDALMPAEREVLVLTYWDGLSAAEIAEALGTTRAGVWARLHRARRAFAEQWRDVSPPAHAPTRATSSAAPSMEDALRRASRPRSFEELS